MPIVLSAATISRSTAPEEEMQMRFRAGFRCLRVGWNEWPRGKIAKKPGFWGVSFRGAACSLASYPDVAGSGRKVQRLDARLGAGRRAAGCRLQPIRGGSPLPSFGPVLCSVYVHSC